MDSPILKGSQTELNLMKAFAGESQARNRYTIFASVAKKEGYEQIAGLFLETADNEKEHAKIYYKYLMGGPLQVNAIYPQCLNTTYENLICAAEGEHEEWDKLYPSFADIADDEGFFDIAKSFRNIAHVETHHEARFKKLAENIKKDEVFKRNNEQFWICRNCGYIQLGLSAPEKCPACKHPKAYFQLVCENY